MSKAPPSSQNRIPKAKRSKGEAQSDVVLRLIRECQTDANDARASFSWQAVNAFSRLERQLWIDLAEARKREDQERADAEQATHAARPDAELLGSIIGAIRSMPADQREQIMEAIGGPVSLRVVRSAGG
jgi:hypothetical protein